MKYWTDQIQKGDVVEHNGHRRKVREVSRKESGRVHSIVVAKRSKSSFESPTTRISAGRLRSDSNFGIVDTGADLKETYLEEQIQRLVEGEPPRPPVQGDLTQDDPIY